MRVLSFEFNSARIEAKRVLDVYITKYLSHGSNICNDGLDGGAADERRFNCPKRRFAHILNTTVIREAL